MPAPLISVFPKCWFDDFVRFERDYVEWIHQAKTLGADGVEHYDGFFKSDDPRDVDPVLEAQRATGQPTSMLCFSPDFTHPDAGERARQVERQKQAIDLAVRLGTRFCRTLSGQRYPDLSVKEGVARASECIKRALEYAEKRDVVLCIENHYKDGTWRFPEFAQQEAVFLELLDAVGESPWFGVQVPSLQRHRRRLRPGGLPREDQAPRGHDARLGPVSRARDDDRGDSGAGRDRGLPRQAQARCDGPGHERLRRDLPHPGGRRVLGWISVEDGMDGLDELRRSVEFLKAKRQQYF